MTIFKERLILLTIPFVSGFITSFLFERWKRKQSEKIVLPINYIGIPLEDFMNIKIKEETKQNENILSN